MRAKGRGRVDSFIRNIRTLLGSNEIDSAIMKCDKQKGSCANVLRAGTVGPAEAEHGEWRYRVRTQRMAVVVAFRSETELRVVTAWRFRP